MRLAGYDQTKPYPNVRRSPGLLSCFFIISILGSSFGCTQNMRRSGIPAGAQAALDTAIEDINAGRYEKLYNEAADEWRRDATPDQSKATFLKLREKLGRVGVRNLQTAREEQSGSAPVEHAVVVIYETSFERGSGMETFTLLERGGKWQLAKYFVSSTALR